ncbi:MAG: ADP-ribosylglycohydrolase family protein [Campylobacterales bacterium]|nr:ADP-ribosylglycohydrolase family protein [Campylobacterales bacterium]
MRAEKTSFIEGALYGALVGDAFALGAHWVYDVAEIKAKFPLYEHFYDPVSALHQGKKAGDFTHYGDQCIWLLESISLEKEFSLASFSSRWKKYMAGYTGYIDAASVTALQNLSSGKSALESGSSAQDLGALGRIAPLVLLYHNQQKSFEDAAVLQTRMTHNGPLIVETARFFTRLLFLVLQGNSPKDSLSALLLEAKEAKIQKWIKLAFSSAKHDSTEAIGSFGQSGSVGSAFVSILHLIVKYEEDYAEAMKQNAAAGGDSALRGMLLGMILGAHNGLESIPKEYLNALNSKARIYAYLRGLFND